jgi:DEAD/DEAH box helicase/Helicase C-terminal domain
MAKKRVFRTDFGETSHVTDPETLFRDLRGRSPEIRHLWSHQADLLRDYYQHFKEAKDVAIELPTGAGKTLVGLLIGEFRRQSFNERVAYLCPTRQLARQVGAQASKYGIKAHVFVGKQRDYPPGEFSEFQSSKALAITTYSAIFNSNPRICDAQSLILDDAHASENYIASMWSVEIGRCDSAELYRSVVNLLRDGLPPSFYADVISDGGSSGRETRLIELVPGEYVRKYSSALRDLLDNGFEKETPAWYAWEIIKEHMAGCGVFVSWDSILIRPFIPPALTHAPFTQANQRVYMSATLGAGGELERITGVKRIQRLPIPPGWDKRGSGRRLFLVPQAAMRDEDALGIVLAGAKEFERTLVLAPTQGEASEFQSRLANIGSTVLGAVDIEDSIDPFATRQGAALVLSRYDGLDLPDEACRLLVMGGLPSGTNLQEKFLWSRIAAFSLLRDRVLTRFTQGVGRCTRSDNDYAVVMVWGRPLVDFILKQDNRRMLHPELQAELQFGIENSRDKKAEDFEDLWRAFIEQGENWEAAEEAIVRLRDRSSRHSDPVSERLCSAVSDEVSYLYSMWNGDYESALEHARRVADSLEGDETKGYRGWWYYLAADAAMALHDANGDDNLVETARDCLKRAGKCCPVISWFARLAQTVRGEAEPLEADEVTATAIENMRAKLTEWGTVGRRFEHEVERAINDLQATDHRQFHRGLKVLGEMLGFRTELPVGDGDPDCIWSIGSELYVAHEAKSDHTPGDPIGINDIRQAQSHEDWVRSHCTCSDGTRILPLIESPRTIVAYKAVAYAKSLRHVVPEQMKSMCEEIAGVLRKVRASASGLSDEKVLESLHSEVTAEKLTPHDIVRRLSAEPVKEMPKSGER